MRTLPCRGGCAIGKSEPVNLPDESPTCQGQHALQATVTCCAACAFVSRGTFKQQVAQFRQRGNAPDRQLLCRSRKKGSSACTVSRFDNASRGQRGHHLGQVIARNVELRGQFRCRRCPPGIGGHAHAGAQSKICEAGQAHSRTLCLPESMHVVPHSRNQHKQYLLDRRITEHHDADQIPSLWS